MELNQLLYSERMLFILALTKELLPVANLRELRSKLSRILDLIEEAGVDGDPDGIL